MTGNSLSKIFEEAGLLWFSEALEEKELARRHEDVLKKVRKRLDAPGNRGAAFFSPSLENLMEIEEHDRAAFLQLFATSCSAEILAAAWFMLLDAELTELSLDYSERARFHLRLKLSYGPTLWECEFESEDVFDAAFLRHIGIMKVSGKPFLDGVYALRGS